jgi:CHAD domain-containing protein
MGFRLKEDESFSNEIKRTIVEQLDEALEHLKPTTRSKDEAIHDVRVCIKKIRALLRLVRDSLGDDLYRREDTAYRDSGRMLSKARDDAAMLEIANGLIEHFSEQLSRDAFVEVLAPLKQSSTVAQGDRKIAMSKAARSLRQARRRVADWPKLGRHLSFSQGLKRVFRSGKNDFAKAYDDPAVETFHEWRKQVKHLLYQSQLLRPIWRKSMKALGRELKQLGEYLSEDHDLAILRERVLEQLEESENRTEIEALVALIDQRRNELQLNARVLGLRIYAEKPRSFISRTEAYWQAWRAESKVDPIAAG